MRKLRLFLACCIAAGMAVPLASPAVAQEADCSGAWVGDYIFSIFPPAYPVIDGIVVLGEGTITIRGDEAVAYLESLPEHYTTSMETFIACLEQEYVEGLVLERVTYVEGVVLETVTDAEGTVSETVTPILECLDATLAPFLSNPDLVSRYIHVGTDLVVTIDYGRALDDAAAIVSCSA
jgi:hypothetical protein